MYIVETWIEVDGKCSHLIDSLVELHAFIDRCLLAGIEIKLVINSGLIDSL